MDEVRIPECHVTELADFFAAHDQWLFGHACVRTRGDRELAADLVQQTPGPSGRGLPVGHQIPGLLQRHASSGHPASVLLRDRWLSRYLEM